MNGFSVPTRSAGTRNENTYRFKRIIIVVRFNIFVMRAILGAVFAVILSRFFYPGTNPLYVAGLGIFLVGMAYILEYWRNMKSDKNKGDSYR